jgi:hypothetical protein
VLFALFAARELYQKAEAEACLKIKNFLAEADDGNFNCSKAAGWK